MRALIEDGGGCCKSRGALLGGHVSHIVCLPETAPSWLAMGESSIRAHRGTANVSSSYAYSLVCRAGADIVSPQWVVQSAMTGSQERCLRLSPDAMQCLRPLDRPVAMARAQVCMLVEA